MKILKMKLIKGKFWKLIEINLIKMIKRNKLLKDKQEVAIL